jgi:hypothetical protein
MFGGAIYVASEMLLDGLSTTYTVILALLAIAGAVALFGRARFLNQAPVTCSPKESAMSGLTSDDRINLSYACDSYAVFKRGQGLRILQVGSPLGPVDLVFSTRYVDGWGPPAPSQGIVVEVRCPAQARQQIDILANLLRHFSSVLSLSANAWVGELASLSEPAPSQRLSQFDLSLMRELDAEATLALFESLGAHPEADQFWSAIHSYRTALGFWTCDQQHLALAHLHRSVLSIAEIFVRISCEKHEVTTADLAKKYQVEEDRLLRYIIQAEFYAGDDECFRAAELACQNAGCGPHPADDDLLDRSELHVSAARYLRNSILRVLDFKEPYRTRLLGSGFDLPCGLGELPDPVEATRSERKGLQLVRSKYDEGYRAP